MTHFLTKTHSTWPFNCCAVCNISFTLVEDNSNTTPEELAKELTTYGKGFSTGHSEHNSPALICIFENKPLIHQTLKLIPHKLLDKTKEQLLVLIIDETKKGDNPEKIGFIKETKIPKEHRYEDF